MKRILVLILMIKMTLVTFTFGQNDSVTISGKVTDFDGRAIKNALIMLKGNDFSKFVDTTYSNRSGEYSLKAKKGKYSGLAAIKMKDYGKTKLEFWAFEIPAYKNLNIDARYDKLEIYGVNVFQVQGAYPGYTIYFRPMSLTRYLSADMNLNILNVAPPVDKIDIQVKINGENVKVKSIQRVEEFTGKQKMYAYLIQTEFGKQRNDKYDEIRILVKDKENGDRGEAIYFKEKVRYE
ncbi:MAG: carboxypeptidase-like regulatory domain-containing protein [bacterium]